MAVKWTVGITTAPREKGYYLDQTIDSLRSAGWDHIVVFAEPGSRIPDDFRGDVVVRRKQYGDWTNWGVGLYELFLSEPDTDYFFMLEDDALVSKCKDYLEITIPQLGEFASLSLYTPSIYHKEGFRGFHNELRGFSTWSTVTVIMTHDKVLDFFANQDVQKHRSHDIFKVFERKLNDKSTSYGAGYNSILDMPGNTLKDALIAKWAGQNKLPIYYHTPALAEHIGFFSTLTDDVSNVDNGRMTKDFVGRDFDSSVWSNIRIRKYSEIMSF